MYHDERDDSDWRKADLWEVLPDLEDVRPELCEDRPYVPNPDVPVDTGDFWTPPVSLIKDEDIPF